MHIAITGGTGLIGRALADHLLRHGHQVTIFTRRPEQARPKVPAPATIARWTPDDPRALAQHLRPVQAVVHLLGENIAAGRWTAQRRRAIYESRIQGGRTLMTALRLAQPRPAVLIQASAVGYYGDRGDEILDESAPPGDDFLARLCVDWENSTAAAENLGMRRAIIRTGVVLSRDGGALPRLLLPIRWGVGGALGSGRQWMPWIHLADEVAAIAFLITHEQAHGAFNLTAPEPVTNLELTRAIARRLHRPAFFRVPAVALRLLFGEMSTVLLASQRAVPRRLQQAGFTFRYPTLDTALEHLLSPAQPTEAP